MSKVCLKGQSIEEILVYYGISCGNLRFNRIYNIQGIKMITLIAATEKKEIFRKK